MAVSNEDYLLLEGGLRRRLLAISEEIRRQRNIKPLNKQELERLKQARSATDRSYSTIKLSLARGAFNEAVYAKEKQAYMEYS